MTVLAEEKEQDDKYLVKYNRLFVLGTSVVTNLTSIHEDVGLIPGLAQRVALSCGVGRRHTSDPLLVAVAGSYSFDLTP